MLLILFINTTVYGQSGQKFATGLNSLSGTDALGSSNNFPLVIKTNGTEKMRITETGRVGIGIISPSEKFEVSGMIRSTVGGFRFPDGSVQSSASDVKKSYVDSSISAIVFPTPTPPSFAAVLLAGRNADATGTVKDTAGVNAIDFNARKVFNSRGQLKIDWENGQLWNSNNNPPPASGLSIDWIARRLYNSSGAVKVDWEQGYLYNYSSGSVISLKWITRELIGFDGLAPSLNWGTRILCNTHGQTSLNWQNRIFGIGQWDYDADYSSNYTNRSLVDKGYVDSTITYKLHHAIDWKHIVFDDVANYSGDYSAAFTARSLVDKQYVDSQLAAIVIPPSPQVFVPGTGQYSAINNQSGNSAQADYSFVGGGTNNSILPIAQYGIIMGGTGNQIENYVTPPPPGILSQYDLIGTGNNNVIKFSAGNSVILSGQNNTIADEYSVILSGNNNSIEAPAVYSKSYNLITGGNDNTIRSSAHHTAIIGGSGNAIANGVANAVILGGTNITATESNAVYVPKIAFPDGSMQEKAGVVAGDSASFSSLRIPNFSGTGDRQVVADANGNLRTMAAGQLSGTTWDLAGNDITLTPFAFLGTLNNSNLVFKTNANDPGNVDPKMVITATGNVGIGTTVPGRNLHVKALSAYCPTCPPSETAYIRLEDEVHDQTITGPVLATHLWDIGADASFFIQNANTNVKPFLINDAGNVGVGGITAPQAKLDVLGTGKFSSDVTIGQTTANANLIVNGNVGIGTTSPQDKLQVQTNGQVNDIAASFSENSTRKIFIVPHLSGYGYNNSSAPDDAGIFWTDGILGGHNQSAGFVIGPWDGGTTSGLRVSSDGNVGIGCNSKGNRLEVNGTIRSKEWIVEETGWCDFKFEPTYQRMTWKEKQDYIWKYKHLPEIAAGNEIETKGLKAGETMRGFIWNIEDNTLDIIDLQKENEQLKKEVDELKKQMQSLIQAQK